MRVNLKAALGAAALVLPCALEACTGFYVGRLASADGTTLIARTVDSRPPTDSFATVVVPRGTDTWHYVCTPYANRSLRYASCIVNERGLAVSGTVTGHTDAKVQAADPFVKDGGACEDTTPEYIGARASTAREAVEMLGAFIARHGNAEANVYLFADPQEAWYAETYTGHHWAAVKMPEDAVAVFGNQFMLESVEPGSADSLTSPGLLDFAEKTGRAVRRADGRIDVARTFGVPLADVANLRTWDGHRRLAPATAGATYETSRRYPLFYRPERKVSALDVMELMRSRMEGTSHCPDTRAVRDRRVIGTEIQCTEHVISVRRGVPAHLACTAWVCHADAEHSVFLPISAAATETARGFSTIFGGNDEYHAEVAACAFRRLSALCTTDRVRRGAGVRRFWRARERELSAGWEKAYAEAVALDATDRAAAAKLLTRFSVAAQEAAEADAKRIFDELVWHMAEHSESFDFRSSNEGVLRPADPVRPFEPKAGAVK